MNDHARTALLAIVTAHFLTDFWLQRDDDVAAKQRFRIRAYLNHAAMHAIVAYLFAGLWLLWQLPAVIFASHGLIDGLKEAVLRWLAPKDADGRPVTGWNFWAVIFDQLLHLAVLWAAVDFVAWRGAISVAPYWSDLFGNANWLSTLVLVSGAILTVFAGGVLVNVLVQPLLEEIRKANQPEAFLAVQRGLEKGGRFIGQLERSLIFLFILTAQPAGVGFLIAAKSILRFGELKDNKLRMEAEYIIIGTMLSFTWAIAVAWLTQWALAAVAL